MAKKQNLDFTPSVLCSKQQTTLPASACCCKVSFCLMQEVELEDYSFSSGYTELPCFSAKDQVKSHWLSSIQKYKTE